MGFACPDCGHIYPLALPEGEKCKVCLGLGNKGAECPCPHYCMPDGRVTSARSMTNAACPIHVAELITAKEALGT